MVNMICCLFQGPPVKVSVTVFIEFIGDIDEINMVCLFPLFVTDLNWFN